MANKKITFGVSSSEVKRMSRDVKRGLTQYKGKDKFAFKSVANRKQWFPKNGNSGL
jgi:hypothetical protein